MHYYFGKNKVFIFIVIKLQDKKKAFECSLLEKIETNTPFLAEKQPSAPVKFCINCFI